jgi:hypothetical protein
VEIESEEDWSLEYVRQQQEDCPPLSQIKYCLEIRIKNDIEIVGQGTRSSCKGTTILFHWK